MSLTFRWLGAAGIELRAGEQVMVLDPFFTRPTLLEMLHPITSDSSLVARYIPTCSQVLVTHAHYDHVLDVPQVLYHTGAVAYGSANTCQLLRLHGVPEDQVKQVQVGDRLSLGIFQVEVIKGQHSSIPLGRIVNGRLREGLRMPLKAWDYRMDECLGYHITVMGLRLLVCAAESHPADILFAGAQESKGYYLKLLKGVRPDTFIPIHWDNFTRPLSKPVRRFTRPGGMQLWRITMLARRLLPRLKVIIPEIFLRYNLKRPSS